MEMDVEMETEEAEEESSRSRSPSSFAIKRLGVKNTIQTNFGDDYVFQIASSQEISTLAVSLSTNAIKFYSPGTGQYFGECKGHSGTINEISFSVPSSAHVISSCSSDGTIRVWDTRTFKQVSLLRAAPSREIFSFCFGGSTCNLLAAGCNTEIHFWDWRNGKQVSCLEDSHVDDVTQVRFAPDNQNKLISASVDGLMCIFNTDGHIDDGDNLESVMNVGTSIAKVGFFGATNNKLWCLTHIETLRRQKVKTLEAKRLNKQKRSNKESIPKSGRKRSPTPPRSKQDIWLYKAKSLWDWKDARKESNFQDARSLASDSWNLDHVDYFVDCYYSGVDDQMWVIGGTNAGTLGYFPVDYKGQGAITSPEAILEGGHGGVVRTVLPVSGTHIGATRKQGIFGWTGGEDGRLCCWLSDESSEANRSWISNALVMKSEKIHKKNRHHPY